MYKKNAAFPIPESDPYRMNLVLLRKKHGYTQAKLAEKTRDFTNYVRKIRARGQ